MNKEREFGSFFNAEIKFGKKNRYLRFLATAHKHYGLVD